MQIITEIKSKTERLFQEILTIRRHIHQNPELSFKEYNTSAYIQSILSKYN
ncbi:MAG: hydrolase, partial [Bacteroidia bacterium]|nr:hydrolase [Bacteroidia bacterium]